jgi:hypothetical protein
MNEAKSALCCGHLLTIAETERWFLLRMPQHMLLTGNAVVCTMALSKGRER